MFHAGSFLNLVILSGDTFTDGSVKYTMTSMSVPEPVMSLAVQPVSKDSGGQVTSSNFIAKTTSFVSFNFWL